MKDDFFFIGWEDNRPKAARSSTAFRAAGLFGLMFGLLGWAAVQQRPAGPGAFAYGDLQSYVGVLVSQPTPLLITEDEVAGRRLFYLVNPFKAGFPKETADAFHLKRVKIRGTLIHDGVDGMIEADGGGISALGEASGSPLALSDPEPVVLKGEIVDSKCHLGVMNPGRFKPHRACAIQCVAGGVPPILVAETEDGRLAHYLLVGPEGEPVNRQLLPYIAEPAQVAGRLRMAGPLRVVYLDPDGVKRL